MRSDFSVKSVFPLGEGIGPFSLQGSHRKMDVTFFLVLVRMEEELNDVREKRAENKTREIGFTRTNEDSGGEG